MNSIDLNSLNEQQRIAVTNELGNTLVLAGAGSGKTRVLINRISWLVQHFEQSPHSILSVTFTNKAASEMRERLVSSLGERSRGVFLGTFHGLAHQILRKFYKQANLSSSFQILASSDQLRLIKKIIQEHGYDSSEIDPKEVQSFINKIKDGVNIPDRSKLTDLRSKLSLDIYEMYERRCEQLGVIDFGEIIRRCYSILLNNEDILSFYQEKYRHFLVDEFQDTNTLQYEWLKLLSKKSLSVFIVGDDDQSIYGWRGAKVENISKFQKDFKDVNIVRLEQNYRSSANILTAANQLIDNNDDRLGKQLWTSDVDGSKISIFGAINEQEEAMYIAKSIEEYIDFQGHSFSDIAILYRSNAQSRVIEEALVSRGLPYKIYGGLRFFERAEIKDILSYMGLAVNLNDDVCFERVINNPPRGIGAKTLGMIRSYSETHSLSLFHSLAALLESNVFSSRVNVAVQQFIDKISALNTMYKQNDYTLTEMVDSTIQISGLIEYFLNKNDVMSQNRVENLNELVNATKDFNFEFQENYNVNPIIEFLSYTALEDVDSSSDNSIQMMTLHSSKGLEFPIVFISGMEESLFPHQMSSLGNKLQEERRLCYVGITRAKQGLHLTFANMRRIFGDVVARKPSRFLKELPKTVLDFRGKTSAFNAGGLASKFDYNENEYKSENNYSDNFSQLVEDNTSQYAIGEKVTHKKFGQGIIRDIVGSGDKVKVQVYFNSFGSKWLLLSYAKLSKIG